MDSPRPVSVWTGRGHADVAFKSPGGFPRSSARPLDGKGRILGTRQNQVARRVHCPAEHLEEWKPPVVISPCRAAVDRAPYAAVVGVDQAIADPRQGLMIGFDVLRITESRNVVCDSRPRWLGRAAGAPPQVLT